MRIVSVEDTSQDLSSLVKEIEGGGKVLITQDGKPVAEIVPRKSLKLSGPEWERAYKEFLELIEKGIPLGGLRFKRDDLYDR